MPPSTITTSGTQSPLVPSALSYPQAVDPTTYLPYASPQIITSSGTWRHPKPGFPISITVTIIGGGGGGGGGWSTTSNFGGGGGAGRINEITALTVTNNVTVVVGAGGTVASQTAGGAGGQSSFGTNTAAGGGGGGTTFNAGQNTFGGAGSVGGGGGCQQYNYTANSYGGDGDTYIGGGGGYGNTSEAAGSSAMRPQTPYPTAASGPNGGAPNGSYALGVQSGGGLLSRYRPDLLFYGDGGDGNKSSVLVTGTAGKQGAIFIWYNRP